MKKLLLFLIFSLISGSILFCNVAAQKVEFVQKDDKIDVLFDGKKITSYVFTDTLTKPIIYPLLSPSGTILTRQYPFAKIEGEATDHKHHTGLFFTFDGANREGFWNNSTIPQKIKHIEVAEIQNGMGRGSLATVSHWIDSTGHAMLEENRLMTFIPGDSAYSIEFDISLKAIDKKVVFLDNKEGMFAVRVAFWLKENGGTGEYLSSNGEKKEKNIWGKRAEWMRLQGRLNDTNYGIVIFNHPTSTNYPTYWHARGYGLFSANPLGQSVFQKSRKEEKIEPFNLTLEPGESAAFRFCVLVYEGLDLQKDDLDKRFQQYKE